MAWRADWEPAVADEAAMWRMGTGPLSPDCTAGETAFRTSAREERKYTDCYLSDRIWDASETCALVVFGWASASLRRRAGAESAVPVIAVTVSSATRSRSGWRTGVDDPRWTTSANEYSGPFLAPCSS